MRVVLHGPPVVNPGKLAVERGQLRGGSEVEIVGARVEREAHHVAGDLGRVRRRPVVFRPPEEAVLVGDGEVEDELAGGRVFVGVGGVAGEGVGGAEPLGFCERWAVT